MGIADVANSLCLSLPDTSSGMQFSQFALRLALNIGDVPQASAATGPSSIGGSGASEEHPEDSAASGSRPFTNFRENSVDGTAPPSDELGISLIETYSERVDTRYSFLDLDEILEWHRDRERLSYISLQSLTASQQFGLFKLYLVYAVGSGLLSLTDKQAALPTPEVSDTRVPSS